jgi:hypothetical protein
MREGLTMTPLEEAQRARDDAAREMRNAQNALHNAEAQLENTQARQMLAELATVLPHLSVAELREKIADHARAHESGKTDAHWRCFRAALAELARRAER